MNAVLILLAVSAIVGLVLGSYFSWIAILASGLVLAIASATVLQHMAFGVLAGIAIIVACLSVNQIAYLVGATLTHRGPKERYASLLDDQPHDDPGQSASGRPSPGGQHGAREGEGERKDGVLPLDHL